MLECFRVKRILSVVLVYAGLGAVMTHTQVLNPPVEMCSSGMSMAKPPLKHLHFDVTLRNAAAGPRWFVFTASFYEKPAMGAKNAGIFAAEVSSDPEHKVFVAHLLGTYRAQPESAGGLKALLLPAGATIFLRNFELSFWGDDPSKLAVRVQITDELKIGGTPLQEWVGTKLLSVPSADVSKLRMVASKKTPDNAELPVQMNQTGGFVICKPHRCPAE